MEKIILKRELEGVKNIVVVASGKGGVGKSTVSATLATSLALQGYSVGLLDADIYGPSLPLLFDIQHEQPEIKEVNGNTVIEPLVRLGVKLMSLGMFVAPGEGALWRGPLAANGMKQMIDQTAWGELDILIIDTPPGTGDIHISLLQEYKVSGVIMVTTPQMLSIGDVEKAMSLYNNKDVGIPVLGVIENMAWFTPEKHPDEQYFLFGKGGGTALAKKFGVDLLAQIPLSEKLCDECDYGKLLHAIELPQIKAPFLEVVEKIQGKLFK